MTTPRHILVGTDFSEGSKAALQTANDYAKAMGAKLTLLHVYPAGVDALGPVMSRVERMDIGQGIHRTLAEFKDAVTGMVSVHTEVLEASDAVSAMCDYAGSHAVDLIILGSHGRSRVQRLLVGSVAERVARHAPCSVLIARS